MKISVILPNFNHASLISQAFEGILAQTHQNWQICVIDDCSTDDSWSVIERYRDRDSRIVAQKATQNSGVVASLRRGFELCTGELLYPAAADDCLSNPRFFELAVTALQRFPQAALAYGRGEIIDGADGRPLGMIGSFHPSPRDRGCSKYDDSGISVQFIAPEVALQKFVSQKMSIPGCSLIMKRKHMEELDGYDETLGPQSDYFLNHALAASHGAVFIDAPVAVQRISEKTYSGSAKNDEYFRCHALVEKKIRALALPYVMDDRPFAQFRQTIINDRLSVAFQRHLFDTVRKFCDSVPPDAFVTNVRKDYARLEAALNEQVEGAGRIFTEVAGPLGPLPLDLESGPRPWLRPVAEFFLTLGRVLGKTFTDLGNWLWAV